MRKKDREVTDSDIIDEIIAHCQYCRLGFSDDGRVYIVPLNFGYLIEDGQRTLYFHGAHEGRKIDLIREVGYAAFEMDTDYKLREGAVACDYTAGFKSIFGEGRIGVVSDSDEKMRGLLAIMKQSTGRTDFDFSERQVHAVCVFKLRIESLSCKIHE